MGQLSQWVQAIEPQQSLSWQKRFFAFSSLRWRFYKCTFLLSVERLTCWVERFARRAEGRTQSSTVPPDNLPALAGEPNMLTLGKRLSGTVLVQAVLNMKACRRKWKMKTYFFTPVFPPSPTAPALTRFQCLNCHPACFHPPFFSFLFLLVSIKKKKTLCETFQHSNDP